MYQEYLKTTTRQEKGATIRVKQITRHFDKFLQKCTNRFLIPKKWTYLEITKHLLNITLWGMIYLMGSYLTFVLLLQLIQDYQSQPTNLGMESFLNTTTGMRVPDYTLCIQADADVLFGSTKRMKNYTEAINVFIKTSTSEGVFKIDPKAIFAKETYMVVWRYLSMMYEGESLNEMGNNPFNNTEYQNDDEWNALKNVLLPNIAAFNITLDQLKSTFDGKFRNFSGQEELYDDDFSCLLTLEDKDSNGRHCSSFSQHISFIGTNHLCLQVLDQKVSFDMDREGNVRSTRVKLSDDRITLYENPQDAKGLFGHNPSLTIDFSGRWTPPDLSTEIESNEIIEFKFADWIDIHFIIQPTIVSMANKNGERICSEEYTMTECLDECRIQQIKEMCGCLPATLSTRHQDSKNGLCTFVKYEECLKYVGDEDSECKTQCVPRCEKLNYEFYVEPHEFSWSASQVEFYFDSAFYAVFTEIPKWTFIDFVGAFGGALGLYLGFDFIILIRFIFDPILMLIRKCISSKNTVVANETHHTQESSGEKPRFEKCREFIKKNITTENTSSRSMFATYLIEKLFWIVLYTAGGIHTIYLCYELCHEYIDEMPTSCNIKLINNKPIALTAPQFCVSYYGFKQLLSKEIKLTFSTNFSDFLTEYFDQERVSRLTLLDENDWPSPLVAVAIHYLNIMNNAEAMGISAMLQSHNSDRYYNIQSAYDFVFGSLSDFTPNESEDMIYAMDNVFEPSLKRLNVSFDEVRIKLGRELIKWFHMSINFVSADSTTFSLTSKTKLTFITYDLICFQLPFDTVLYSDESEYIEVSTHIPKYSIHRCSRFHLMLYPSSLTGAANPATARDLRNVAMLFGSGTNIKLSVGILKRYKLMSKKNNNVTCTIASTQEECHATCRIRLIRELCNCTPITWPTLLTADANLCTLREYNQCLNYSLVEDSKCVDKCFDICEQYNFFYEGTSATNYTARELCGAINLRIYVKDFSYILFEDQYKWSFKSFLASLGGLLGLWLGLTIYTFFDFVIVIPISFFVSHCARKNIVRKMLTSVSTYSEICLGIFTITPVGQIFCRIFKLDNQDIEKILTAKWITKNILTIIYYVISIFLTYHMCTDTIQNYLTETESSYNFTKNDTINLISYPTVCLPHSVNMPLNETADENFNEGMIQLFHDLITDSSSLLLGDMNVRESVLRNAISFIAYTGIYERVEWNQKVREFDYGPLMSFPQLQLFEDMLMYMDATHTSMNDLMQKCGREVRKADNITVRLYQPDKDSFQYFEISETAYIDEIAICYKVPFKEFSSLSEYIEINVKLSRFGIDESYWSKIESQVDDYLFYNDDSVISYSTLPLSFFMVLGLNASTELKIEAEYNYLKVLHGIERCSDTISQEDCQRYCRFQAMRQLCSCSPLSLSNTTNNILKRCSMDQYKTCLPFTFNVSKECMSECLLPCKRIRFSEKKFLLKKIEPHTANLKIKMRSFDFAVANESAKWTFSEFQGEFGGALSLWIALDVLVFVNALYTIIRCILKLYFVLRRFKQERQAVASAT